MLVEKKLSINRSRSAFSHQSHSLSFEALLVSRNLNVISCLRILTLLGTRQVKGA